MQTAGAPYFGHNGQFVDGIGTDHTPKSAVVANEGMAAYIIIDSVQFVPVRIANAERTGKTQIFQGFEFRD